MAGFRAEHEGCIARFDVLAWGRRSTTNVDRSALEARLLAALDREPPRAGFHHSGEAILRAASRGLGRDFPAWLEALPCRDSLDPGDRADILRPASRLGLPAEAEARRRVAG